MTVSFSSLGLHPSLLAAVRDLGYDQATPIQADAIPPALAGRDVLACAMTGSGKTAAFMLPTIQRLAAGEKRGAARALVLAPTRELAAQVDESCRALAKGTKIKSAAIFGGVAIGPQKRAFEAGVDIPVATPGRLLDHLQYPYARLDGIEILILDEADRMLDMGFLPDVRRVLAHLPKRPRQTLFFSATLPGPIIQLSKDLLVDAAQVAVERKAAPATGVTQTLFPVRETLKPALLVELLRRNEIPNALVFTRTKHRANRLADYLASQNISSDRIHGNRSQAQRTQALAMFKDGRIKVLVATDIAARGIDVEGLSHVVNVDVPAVPEDYIHRVGRTARAGAVGDAFTFVSDGELQEIHAIERAIGKKLPRRTLEGFDYQQSGAALEIPLKERLAKIRAERAEARARAAAKAERKAAQGTQPAARTAQRPAQAGPRPQGQGQSQRQSQPRPAAAGQRPAGPGRNDGRRPSGPSRPPEHRPSAERRGPAQPERRAAGPDRRPAPPAPTGPERKPWWLDEAQGSGTEGRRRR
ncbi:MAG: DEAD/DEAH box helicase [Thermoanaerobaculia bacterium]|nr:DEAD/DEAH box helicase [Thermoanaerobaculia bacterium]